jgi:hypothetical protein
MQVIASWLILMILHQVALNDHEGVVFLKVQYSSARFA